MGRENTHVQDIVSFEIEKARRKTPELKEVDIVYEKNIKGSFLSKLRAKTNNKVIVLIEKSRCQKKAIRKVFSRLQRVLHKRKKIKRRKSNISYLRQEA